MSPQVEVITEVSFTALYNLQTDQQARLHPLKSNNSSTSAEVMAGHALEDELIFHTIHLFKTPRPVQSQFHKKTEGR
jgi:hypothetical protein